MIGNHQDESNSVVPSTPSWMTDQRQRRQNRRGYGRSRHSGVGPSSSGRGIHSTASRNRRRETPLFGTAVTARSAASTLDFDNEVEDHAESVEIRFLRTSNAKPLGGRPPRPHQSDQARPEDRTGNAVSVGLDLMEEFEHINKSKKTRPNLPRPPPRTMATADKTISSKFTTPLFDATPFDFKSETSSFTESGSHKNYYKSLPLNDTLMAVERAKTTMHAMTSESTSSLSTEENVHPNGTSEIPVNQTCLAGARRSSRLGKMKARADNGVVSGLSSFDEANREPRVISENNRPRERVNSKKRSAISPAGIKSSTKITHELEYRAHSPSKIVTRAASLTSFSTGPFSKSTSSIVNIADSSRSESFSTLAQRSSSQSWATCTNGSNQNNEIQRSSSVASNVDKNGVTNNNSSSNALKTPSARPSVLRQHPNSCGNVLLEMNTVYSPSLFLSPQGGGTTQSTPTASSTSSRKRRSADFTSTPVNDEIEEGFERARSRKSSPSSPLNMDHDINELSTTASLRAGTTESVGPMNFFSSPPIATNFGCDEMLDKTLEHVRDKLNDVSMISARSDDDDDNSTTTSSSEDECEDADADDDVTPREMTDVEIFESKSSYEDFKFLTKSLQKWSESSYDKVASMGLNNGCLIAVPPNWNFERRANFSKWVSTAFGFRVGSVGGTGGSFLRCSEAEGKGVLARLLRILNDYKNNGLAFSTTETNANGKLNESKEAKPKARYVLEMSIFR